MSSLTSSILLLIVSFERGIWDNFSSAAFPSMIFTIFNAAGFTSVSPMGGGRQPVQRLHVEPSAADDDRKHQLGRPDSSEPCRLSDSMARVGHAGMTADEVTENIEAAFQTVAAKLRTKSPVIKLIHIKSQTSGALPIYTSDLNHLSVLDEAEKQAQAARQEAAAKKQAKKNKAAEEKKSAVTGGEIPQLVPIATPSKKPKLEKAPKPAAAKKGRKGKKAPNKMTKTSGKTESKGKRRVPKVK
ncbi:uncharacterized protein LOC115024419 isoform X2 [Cottoperca gobio]|uniref:Uncharacterized protein LOC115004978 isoform X2 n=1 Tax=Cottoperca gobio TaxID=56716 RepID=A0A6J2P996_COTGO|nr:uncharacterized protein LOC115004978 isoform X2 [Cottoperca gobio]XP_029284003.1 uncharacterized protein LOC115006089 isoform X2 [Cottoperca gobio]XP_029311799.1 uncharacterized protein LOC115024419 isoform X2 [Cottoperca gobio]